jgi:RHS repeat-associated protein
VRDALGRVVVEADPEGNTKRTTYDHAGRVKEVMSPNEAVSTHEYDGRARLRWWKDPEGLVWRYDYDGIQNITNITDALGGHYMMRYGLRNERLLERNQDGFEWNYIYDALLRLKQQRDPNGLTRTAEFDAAGRTLSITFSSGRVDSFLYDANNNPQVLSRSGSGPATLTSLKYDPLDRVVETTDAFGKTVKFGYDARGLRTTTTYPDSKVLTNSYDGAGRLSRQADWAGRQSAYGYDAAGRLIVRVYPNGVAQTNMFDDAGRLSRMSYSSVGVNSNSLNAALSYAYDRNGNKIGWSEKGTMQWPLPSMTDESARFTPAGRLMDRQIQNTLSNQVYTVNYHYDASGNMTNAVGTGQSWSLTYDEDNRATSISWDAGITAKTIVNRYDALGRRISKTVDGTEIRYILDISGGMERVLCDVTTSGAITAWYVHGPDLAYKVDTTSGVVCFHADAQANIIALSDGAANTVAQYAYSPYGRNLGIADSAISNPYLFVGSQGVMEDLPGLYFMRARYYSAETAAFLSTDPVKPIGPKWMPAQYWYSQANPLSLTDPAGLFGVYLNVGAHHVNGSDDFGETEYSQADYEDMIRGERWMNSIDKAALFHDRDLALAAETGDFREALKANRTLYASAVQGTVKELFSGHLDAAVVGLGVTAAFQQTSLGFSAGDLFNALTYKKLLQNGDPSAVFQLGFEGLKNAGLSRLASKSPGAAKYAGLLNDGQATIAKLPTLPINFAADYIGGIVAEAFGRILPKHTPPIIREALTLAVRSVVNAAATALISTVAKIIFAIFGVPKGLALAILFIVGVGMAQHWRQMRFRQRLRFR